MRKDKIQQLLRAYADNTISENQRKELYNFLKDDSNKPLFVDALMLMDTPIDKVDVDESHLSLLDKVYRVDKPAIQVTDDSKVTVNLPSLYHQPAKIIWLRYAAAIALILCLGAVAYLWTTNKKTEQLLVSDNQSAAIDLPPGGQRAVLTLADGTRIVLDNAANGDIAQQGNAQVVKLDNGQIAYNIKGSSQQEVMLNTMSTPKGGQYQLLLPDGTKVWLNAASSITYPAVFVGEQRKVKIDGEVYFEVAANKEKPFIVDVDGKSTIRVLGTSFNINAYENEKNINTTLLTGSVQINNRVVLKAGQQAIIKDDADISTINNSDLEKAVAWKNGLFSFNNADLVSVMRQLERWYDVKVEYQSDISDLVLRGEMYRSVNLSTILDFLKKMGVNVRLEEKTLIVL